jgi:hypothetical protein
MPMEGQTRNYSQNLLVWIRSMVLMRYFLPCKRTLQKNLFARGADRAFQGIIFGDYTQSGDHIWLSLMRC